MENLTQMIQNNPRSTPVKAYLWLNRPVKFPDCYVFQGSGGCLLVFGQWERVERVLQENADAVICRHIECDRRRSAMPLLDIRDINARIEPSAVLRQGVTVGENAVILMGAIVNVGASIGEGTMVDMGAIIGGGAQIGRFCHIGAGAVIAGVLEPACPKPVTVEDGVLVGANAVILEGITVGKNAVVAAGAVVTRDVQAGTVVAGCPARFVKIKDEKTAGKTALTDGLR